MALYKYINKYFESICQGIYNNNGFIDKFIGDCVMALFENNSDNNQNSAANSVLTAIEMQKALKKFNAEQRDIINHTTRIGIGIHTGSVLLGTVGTEKHVESTVLGENVNIASRLEYLNKDYHTDILISERTLLNLGNTDDINYRPLGGVRVRGVNREIKVFEIYNHNEPEVIHEKNSTKGELEEALTLIENNYYDEGIKILENIHKRNQGDQTIAEIINRIKK